MCRALYWALSWEKNTKKKKKMRERERKKIKKGKDMVPAPKELTI